ncbi:hypothetical protein [Cryobacterium sp. M15]|uniref:hypothetical protein n=1 Tax=Cryobacterium sp. M15 TaxID=2048291 RepID=UPI000CE48969|nr:hypothetical protein [Cryobacterium sp. M15]
MTDDDAAMDERITQAIFSSPTGVGLPSSGASQEIGFTAPGPLFDTSSSLALHCAFCTRAFLIQEAASLAEHWRHLKASDRAAIVIQSRSLPSDSFTCDAVGTDLVINWINGLELSDYAKYRAGASILADIILRTEVEQ